MATLKKAVQKTVKKDSKTETAQAPKVAIRRTVEGIVVSDKMMKTRVVKIERQVKNGRYGKITSKSNKVKIHDENNASKKGDLVSIVECRPMSKDKRWALQKILRKGSSALVTLDV